MARDYTFEQIEEFLDGQLSEDEKKEFEQEIEINAELKNEVAKHRQVRKLNELHTRQQLKKKIKNIHQQVKVERQPAGGFSIMKIAASIALLLVAGALYFYLQNEYSSDTLAENVFEPYPNRYRTMGDEIPGDFTNAMEFYDMEKFQQAVEILDDIPETDSRYLPAQFYLGISYLKLDKPALSIESLQIVMDSESTIYRDAANWYLSLAYLENKEEDKAKSRLITIVNEDGYQAEKARTILRKLNSPVRKIPGID